MSYTSASERNGSRIYEDLRAIRLNGIQEPDPSQVRKALAAVDGKIKVTISPGFLGHITNPVTRPPIARHAGTGTTSTYRGRRCRPRGIALR